MVSKAFKLASFIKNLQPNGSLNDGLLGINVTNYNSANDVRLATGSAGSFAYIDSDNSLYFNNGTGWVGVQSNISLTQLTSLAYANAIATETGGNIIIHDPVVDGTDLTWVLNNYNNGSPATPPLPALSNGDVLYLLPGDYTTTSWKTTFSANIFPRGFYSVIGADPQITSIYVDQGLGNPPPRAESIASWDVNGASTATYPALKLNIGFLTLVQYAYGAANNYQIPLFHGLGAALHYITMKNVAVNRLGTNASWIYDNDADQGTIRVERCSLFNINQWYGNYSGSLVNKSVADSIITGTNYNTAYWPETNVAKITNADFPVVGLYGSYDTGIYNDKGHLFLDGTSSNYTQPTNFG